MGVVGLARLSFGDGIFFSGWINRGFRALFRLTVSNGLVRDLFISTYICI